MTAYVHLGHGWYLGRVYCFLIVSREPVRALRWWIAPEDRDEPAWALRYAMATEN